MTTSLDWLANENILFTKSAITSECHNTFWWNKKTAIWINDLLKQCNVTFLNFNILTIAVTQLLPKMQNGQNWPKIGPKMPFSSFSPNYFWCFCWNIPQNSTYFLNGSYFKISSKKNFFLQVGLRGPETAQSRSKLHFCQDYLHLFVETFSIYYL